MSVNNSPVETFTETDFGEEGYAEVKRQLTAASNKVLSLLEERSQLTDGPASRGRRREIDDEVKALIELRTSLRTMLAELNDAPRETSPRAATPSPERANAPESRPVVPHNLPKFRSARMPSTTRSSSFFEFERVLSTSGLDVDQHWRRLFHLCLDSSDARWVSQELDANADLEGSQECVLAQFGDPDRIRQDPTSLSAQYVMRPANRSASSLSAFEEPNARQPSCQTHSPMAATFHRENLPSEVRYLVEARDPQGRNPELTVTTTGRYCPHPSRGRPAVPERQQEAADRTRTEHTPVRSQAVSATASYTVTVPIPANSAVRYVHATNARGQERRRLSPHAPRVRHAQTRRRRPARSPATAAARRAITQTTARRERRLPPTAGRTSSSVHPSSRPRPPAAHRPDQGIRSMGRRPWYPFASMGRSIWLSWTLEPRAHTSAPALPLRLERPSNQGTVRLSLQCPSTQCPASELRRRCTFGTVRSTPPIGARSWRNSRTHSSSSGAT